MVTSTSVDGRAATVDTGVEGRLNVRGFDDDDDRTTYDDDCLLSSVDGGDNSGVVNVAVAVDDDPDRDRGGVRELVDPAIATRVVAGDEIGDEDADVTLAPVLVVDGTTSVDDDGAEVAAAAAEPATGVDEIDDETMMDDGMDETGIGLLL